MLVSIPTPEYRDTLSILRSTTTTDPRSVEYSVNGALAEIAQAVQSGDPKSLARWARVASRSMDAIDVTNVLHAGCTAFAKAVLRHNRPELSRVVTFLQTAQHHAADILYRNGLTELAASA